MRIAIVAPFHNFGGSENQILLFLQGLRKRGVSFVFFHLDIQSPELLEELESISGCEHVEIRLRSIIIFPLLILDSLRLAKLLHQYQCDLVHCWNYTGHIIGGIASKLARKKCIFSIGGLDPWKKSWQLIFYRIINSFADLFVFQSVAERDIVSKRESISVKKTIIIANGIDQERFNIKDKARIKLEVRKELDLPIDVPLILSIGSLRPIKGYDVLIEAIRRIQEDHPNFLFHVLIAGLGPFRGAYEQSAKGLPITFLGFRKDIDRLCFSADIYCQPSRSEGLPNAVIEALCCELPVVATDVGGTGDLVTDDNGILCKPGDPEILALILYELLVRPKDWPMMGMVSLRLSKRFSADKMVDSYVSTFKSLLWRP